MTNDWTFIYVSFLYHRLCNLCMFMIQLNPTSQCPICQHSPPWQVDVIVHASKWHIKLLKECIPSVIFYNYNCVANSLDHIQEEKPSVN